jgi:hypothetical protein
VVEGPGFLGAQAKNWSVVKIWVALEGSRGLARDEDSNFYWIETLENYLHTGPKSTVEKVHLRKGGGGIVSLAYLVPNQECDMLNDQFVEEHNRD